MSNVDGGVCLFGDGMGLVPTERLECPVAAGAV